MTLMMRIDFLHNLLLTHLQKATTFPTPLPRPTNPLQIVKFTQFRDENDKTKTIAGAVSDKFTSVICQFSAECCNDYALLSGGKRLSEMRGALIFADKWELNVLHIAKTDKFRVVVKIDLLRSHGCEGEAVIGDPRDFNTYRDVNEYLLDPKRRRLFLGVSEEPTQEEFSSQQDTSQYQTQLPDVHQPKRRKKEKEQHPGWANIKNITFKDYQITPAQKAVLESEESWVTPDNIDTYKAAPQGEEQALSTPLAVVNNGQNHPPLSSPVVGQDNASASRNEDQFETQAPPMISESQLKNATPEPEDSGEKVSDWEPTPSPDRNRKRDEPPPLDSDDEELPQRQLGSSPPLREDSPESQPPIDDEPPSSPPERDETFFTEDVIDVLEGVTDEGVEHILSASMNVSTAELLTQEPSLPQEPSLTQEPSFVAMKEVVIEVREVEIEDEDEDTEDVENVEEERAEAKQMIDDHVDMNEDSRELEEMQQVEPTAPSATVRQDQLADDIVVETTIEQEIIIESTVDSPEQPSQQAASVEEPSRIEQSLLPPAATQLHTQVPSTQDESSASTVYPASTQSNPPISKQDISQITTEDDSQQSQSHIRSSAELETPTILSTIPPILPQPPAYRPTQQQPTSTPNLPYQISPPKATPSLLGPASAQIQVQETPFSDQGLVKRQQLFPSSTTHISATAPAMISPVKRPAEESQRRHKRQRHVGPIIPKFSRRERKMTCILEEIILEDRKKFLEKVTIVEKENEMEDVIEESFERDKLETKKHVERKSQSVNEEIPQPSIEVARIETFKTRIQSSLMETPPPARAESSRLRTETPANDPDPSQLADTQDDSQAYDPSQSRWGHFAKHWRRFTHFP